MKKHGTFSLIEDDDLWLGEMEIYVSAEQQ